MTTIETFETALPREARFWDKIADRYAAKPVPDAEIYARKLEITRRYLTPESQVVEFGCGTGSTAIAHAPHVRQVLATDISPRMIEIAREKAREAGTDNVRFEVTSIGDLRQPPESVDVVLGLSILHLVPDLDATLATVHDMLKPRGVFVSSTACLGDGMTWFAPILALGRVFGVFPPVTMLRAQGLRDALTRHGFALEEDWPTGDGRTWFSVARKAG